MKGRRRRQRKEKEEVGEETWQLDATHLRVLNGLPFSDGASDDEHRGNDEQDEVEGHNLNMRRALCCVEGGPL
jgi:hypothetical protein